MCVRPGQVPAAAAGGWVMTHPPPVALASPCVPCQYGGSVARPLLGPCTPPTSPPHVARSIMLPVRSICTFCPTALKPHCGRAGRRGRRPGSAVNQCVPRTLLPASSRQQQEAGCSNAGGTPAFLALPLALTLGISVTGSVAFTIAQLRQAGVSVWSVQSGKLAPMAGWRVHPAAPPPRPAAAAAQRASERTTLGFLR